MPDATAKPGRQLAEIEQRPHLVPLDQKRLAARTGDLQTKKEIEVFRHRLDTAGS